MTKQRFIRLLMAHGYSKREALEEVRIFHEYRSPGLSYEEYYEMISKTSEFALKNLVFIKKKVERKVVAAFKKIIIAITPFVEAMKDFRVAYDTCLAPPEDDPKDDSAELGVSAATIIMLAGDNQEEDAAE